jgi:hypothetical protein
MKILAWDIETRPLLVHTWGMFNQNVSLNQLLETTEVMCFAARWVDEPKSSIIFRSTFHDGKRGMLETAHRLFDQADALLSWNGKAFDTRHMNREYLLAGMAPPSPSKEIDLLQTSRSQFRFASNKLDHVAQQLGVGAKKTHEGFGLWLGCLADDPASWDKMRRYNEQDVHLLVKLYKRMLPWIKNHPNVNLYEETDGKCPRCSSTKLQSRGTRKSGVASYRRWQCQSCGGWSTSGKRVAGADVRSE